MDNLPIFDSNRIADNRVFDPSRSMFIEASAGTGKTYTIQQIVARLIHDGTPIHKILIVTFTEKAAGELKDRIRNKIQEVLQQQTLIPKDGRTLNKEKLALFDVALRDLDSAQIFTIHSFCQKTLKTYAYDAWRPFDMKLVDDALIKNIIQRKLRDEWPKNPEFQKILELAQISSKTIQTVVEDIETILVNAVSKYYLDNNGKERIIRLNTPPNDDDLLDYININDYSDLLKLSNFKKIITIFTNHIDYQLSTPKNKDGKRTIQIVLDLLKNWKSPNKLISGYPKAYKTDWNWPLELSNAYTELNSIRDKIENTRDGYSIYMNSFLAHELPVIYQEWRQEKLDHKWETYQDMITVVYQAIVLESDNALRQELRKTYQYAIIDEFQDTNRLQWDIFRTLFFNVQDHSIFVVGDPKQSIYAFQGADLTVYRDAINTIGFGKRLETNFRSTNEIIDACNALFNPKKYTSEEPTEKSAFFPDETLVFEDSQSPTPKKAATTFDQKTTAPVWLSTKDISEYAFAHLAAQKIVECCTRCNDGSTRLQIFDKKEPSHLRNVTFKDFAVLARTRSEFPPIEAELKKLGIPFIHYKDDNLFNSRECMQWIALFKAIDADDFSAYNRRILSEALLTDFFKPFPKESRLESSVPFTPTTKAYRKLHTVNLNIYDDPQCPERKTLAEYHTLARRFRWAEMLESIYRHSNIEADTASDLSKLQSLAKFQQIGNYCIEYLYAHRCTLNDLIKHLDNLQKQADKTSDKDGNLVARNTDFDAVQLMTIHASKGLEFPVVIGVCGFVGYNGNAKGPFTFHNTENDTCDKMLGFDDDSKKNQKLEDITEWHRLFYVAYTRASALLILPQYHKDSTKLSQNDSENGSSKKQNKIGFLKQSLTAFANEHRNFIKEISTNDDPSISDEKLRQNVLDILKASKETGSEDQDFAKQQEVIQALQNSLSKKTLFQHSYSSLASKVQLQKVEIPQEALDSEGKSTDFASDGDDSEDEKKGYRYEPNVDLEHRTLYRQEDYNPAITVPSDADYPKGKQLGNAIHGVFEKIDFSLANASLDEFVHDSSVLSLIDQTYGKYGIPLNHHPEWRTRTAQFVWNTLNAKLPLIEGTEISSTFSLHSLAEGEHFSEVEFWLEGNLIHNQIIPKTGEYYCKGYMDMIFKPKGSDRYAILDWKSDRLEEGGYATPAALSEKVDREYAVQRVLYSYCLIQWLKQFYPNLKESDIFKRYFGGIYYVFIRGTAANTANGIYAQTWDSYEQLANNYKTLKSLMFKSASPSKENKDND